MFKRYDALTLFDRLVDALPAELREGPSNYGVSPIGAHKLGL